MREEEKKKKKENVKCEAVIAMPCPVVFHSSVCMCYHALWLNGDSGQPFNASEEKQL